MFNWILTKNANNNVEYLMVAGKNTVIHHMPYERALHMAQHGVVSIGNDSGFPVAVNNTFFFRGEIEPLAKAEPENEPAPADSGKKKSKKKVEKDAE